MTEVGVNCFAMTVEDSVRKPGSIGKPLMFTEVRLVDERRRGGAGRRGGGAVVRGPHVWLGYWNNPEATARGVDADGWFRTGDLARRDADGFFYIAGRAQGDVHQRRRERLSGRDRGGAAVASAVRDAAVVAIADATGARSASPSSCAREASAEELPSTSPTRLAKYKLPRRFVFVDALPRTPTERSSRRSYGRG